ncbi:sodium:calcium antiporter, partial [Peribacillus sp. SIMBA_075]
AGQTDLAVGNVVGSNIFNVLFVLGLSALIAPLVVHTQIIRQEVPILIGASVLMLALSLDGGLGLWDGALLLGLLIAYTVFLV